MQERDLLFDFACRQLTNHIFVPYVSQLIDPYFCNVECYVCRFYAAEVVVGLEYLHCLGTLAI